VSSCLNSRSMLTLSSFVDSGFWNFDALFVPQQHPARDMQDTFFVSDPPKADKPRADPASEATMDAMEASSQRLFSTGESRDKKPRDFEKYWQDVKKVHEDGAFGSIGCKYCDSHQRPEPSYS
jgi:phenylalanyl-tRNA synthetase alpha chain